MITAALLSSVVVFPVRALAATEDEGSGIVDAPADVVAVNRAPDGALAFAGPSGAIETRQGTGMEGAPVTAPPVIPQTTGICPGDSPIKAASTEEGDRFFYAQSDPSYEAIIPENCFANEGAAAAGGYQMHGH